MSLSSALASSTAASTPASAEALLAMIEEGKRRCRRVKISSASLFFRSGSEGCEKARKGARGCVRPRAAGCGGGENRAKKIFFEGAFCGAEIEMTQ